MKPKQFNVRPGNSIKGNAFTVTDTKPSKTATVNVHSSAWACPGMKVMIGNKLFRVLRLPHNEAMRVKPI